VGFLERYEWGCWFVERRRKGGGAASNFLFFYLCSRHVKLLRFKKITCLNNMLISKHNNVKYIILLKKKTQIIFILSKILIYGANFLKKEIHGKAITAFFTKKTKRHTHPIYLDVAS
jgi:hypothetical protein